MDKPAFDNYSRIMQQAKAENGTPPGKSDWAADYRLEEFRAVHMPEPNLMTYVARVFAAIIMLILWVAIVLPVWFALLLRTILAFSVATIISLFGGSAPPHPGRLDAVSTLWMNGFRRIIANIVNPEGQPGLITPVPFLTALSETVLAIIFYASVAVSVWLITIGILEMLYQKLFRIF